MIDIRLSLSDRIDTLRDGTPPRMAYVTFSPPQASKIAVWLDLVQGLLLAQALALIGKYIRSSFPSFLINPFTIWETQ